MTSGPGRRCRIRAAARTRDPKSRLLRRPAAASFQKRWEKRPVAELSTPEFVKRFEANHYALGGLVSDVIASKPTVVPDPRYELPVGWERRFNERLTALKDDCDSVAVWLVRVGRRLPPDADKIIDDIVGAWERARAVVGQKPYSQLGQTYWPPPIEQARDDAVHKFKPIRRALELERQAATGEPGDEDTRPSTEEVPEVLLDVALPGPDTGLQATAPASTSEVAAAPVPARSEAGPLGITLDLQERKATRGAETVDFGGKEYAWKLFCALCRKYPDSFLAGSLTDAVWGQGEGDVVAMQAHISALRKIIRPLGLAVKHIKRRGYALQGSL
jgi:hypothetical protein